LQRDLINTVIADKISFSQQKASTVFYHIINALKELHDAGEVHRDLKLDNLMFTHQLTLKQTSDQRRLSRVKRENDPFLVKIIDCGAAETLPSGSDFIRGKDQHGTGKHFAPETLGRFGIGDTEGFFQEKYLHGKASDVWQAGIVLYNLLFQTYPVYTVHGVEKSFATEASPDVDQNGHARGSTHIWPRFECYSPELLQFTSNTKLLSETGRDLFKKIFVLNPDERITCDEILAHDWITEFASLPDEDFGKEYRARVKDWKLRRQLRSTVEHSLALCNERKESFFAQLASDGVTVSISTTQFRDMQHQFLEAIGVCGEGDRVSVIRAGITWEMYNAILTRNGLAALATEEAFRVFDIDGNNTIEYFEFLPVLSMLRERSPSVLAGDLELSTSYFLMFDLNGDGKISRCD
jgi:serine/threonine protein kinase